MAAAAGAWPSRVGLDVDQLRKPLANGVHEGMRRAERAVMRRRHLADDEAAAWGVRSQLSKLPWWNDVTHLLKSRSWESRKQKWETWDY